MPAKKKTARNAQRARMKKSEVDIARGFMAAHKEIHRKLKKKPPTARPGLRRRND